MKIVIKIIRWAFGIFFCLGALGGFLNGDNIMAIIVLGIGFLFLPPVTEKLFGKKSDKNLQSKNDNVVSASSRRVGKNKSEITLELNEENLMNQINQKQQKRAEEIKNFDYHPDQIQRRGIQLLESLNILFTTKNIDTLKGRYEFILKMYDDFEKASYHGRYSSDIQIAIDEYKTMYYDKIINAIELEILAKPNKEKLLDFYSDSLFNCFNEFTKEQELQILNLKRADAKTRRKEKIVNVANETITELDNNGSQKEKYKKYIQLIQEKRDSYKNSNNKFLKNKTEVKVKNEVRVNSKSAFPLTFYNSEKKVLFEIIEILNDETNWHKSKILMPIFAEHNIKCKEVEEYILRYKPIYLKQLNELKSNSKEYQDAFEMDKLDIEEEFKEQVINGLYERANCKLDILFDLSEIDITVDDELIKRYSFETISKYFSLQHYQNKIISKWERKDFEDLIKADLVFSGNDLDIEDVLKSQTLKILNRICEKEEGHFKRKNKAILYLKENENLLGNVGKHISTRRLFKLKPLPKEYKNLEVKLITDSWLFLEEYLKLISETYNFAKQNMEEMQDRGSWISGYKVEKIEDLNSNFVCQRAREECKKKYSKSNPPKLPFHIGCNCDLRVEG